MRAGDIVFIDGNTIPSWFIKKVDKGQWSHVAMALSSTHIIEAQYLTKTRIIPMNYLEYKVIDLGLNDLQRDRIVHAAVDLTGRWYDYAHVAWYFINSFFEMDRKKIWNVQSNLICSELVYMLLKEVGFLQADEFLGNITPNELYLLIEQMIIKN